MLKAFLTNGVIVSMYSQNPIVKSVYVGTEYHNGTALTLLADAVKGD
jgi:hypothetical protein